MIHNLSTLHENPFLLEKLVSDTPFVRDDGSHHLSGFNKELILRKNPTLREKFESNTLFAGDNESQCLIGFRSEFVNHNNTDERENISAFGGIIPMLVEAGAKIVETLPQFGVGRKARTKEAQAYSDIKTKEAQTLSDINNQTYKTQIEIDEQKTKQTQKIVFVGGSMLLVLIVVLIALRS